MEVRNVSNYQFKKLKRMHLDNSIYNTEGILYIIDSKDKWEKNKELLKFFYNDSGAIFSNKLYTINELIEKREVINIPEIVMPNRLITLNGKAIGFTMPYVDNINFDLVLKDFRVSNKQKIEYFKQIGAILDRMKKVRENTEVNDFFLNDLHEKNFILNTETNSINVVDIDSCKINGNKAFASRYLTPMSSISDMPNKYKVNTETKFPGYIIADENTDLYCYMVMVLNFLYKDNITRLSIEEFYTYLDYLRTLGLSYNLLDKFNRIYEYADNQNIYEELGLISDDIIHKSSKNVFLKKL